jgi:two-component sensor histidine kinase
MTSTYSLRKLLTNSVAQAEELIAQPRAHGGVGLQVVRVLASAQEALEQQANQGTTVSIVSL